VFATQKFKNQDIQTIILYVVLYGCETWSLTLREERRLRVFENRMLRRIFGPMRDEVTREWRILHNEELILFGFGENEIGGACSTYGRGVAYIGVWWGNLRKRAHLGYPVEVVRII
jgi:hypothetical protein